MSVHQGRRSRLLNIRPVYREKWVTVTGITHYVYTGLKILCDSIYHYTTLAGEWLNNVIFHDNIKCFTANDIADKHYLCWC